MERALFQLSMTRSDTRVVEIAEILKRTDRLGMWVIGSGGACGISWPVEPKSTATSASIWSSTMLRKRAVYIPWESICLRKGSFP